MGQSDKRPKWKLASLILIPVKVLELTARVHKLLTDHGFRSIAQLYQPGKAQREAFLPQSAQSDLPEIKGKWHHFYRCYRAARRILQVVGLFGTRPPKLSEPLSQIKDPPPEVPQLAEEAPINTLTAQPPVIVLQLPATITTAGNTSILPQEQIELLSDGKSSLTELLDRWIRCYLPRRERLIIESHYGLYEALQPVARLAKQGGVSDTWTQSLQDNAIEVLRKRQEELSPIFQLVSEILLEGGGVLAADMLVNLLGKYDVNLGGMRPAGVLAFLAALNDDWVFCDVDAGVLVLADAPIIAEDVAGSTQRKEQAVHDADMMIVHAQESESNEVLASIPDVAMHQAAEITIPLGAAADEHLDNDRIGVEIVAGEMEECKEEHQRTTEDLSPIRALQCCFEHHLTEAQREVVERRYGFYEKPESLTQIAASLQLPEAKARQLERSALHLLRENQHELTSFLSLLSQELTQRRGVLHLSELVRLPEFRAAEADRLLLTGVVSLLAEINDEWRYYHLNDGILMSFKEQRRTLAGEPAERMALQTEQDKLPVTTALPAAPEETPSHAELRLTDVSTQGQVTSRKIAPLPIPQRTESKRQNAKPPRSSPARRRRKINFNPQAALYPVEMELQQRLQQVDFIGELAIEKEQFESWCKLIQKEAKNGPQVHPRRVPPTLFVTMMVLTARYSEEEARIFWQPYARMVWGLEEASQSFQGRCRDYFGDAITFLTEEYDMAFPQRSAGDVVRPVYRHAIIPAYLEPIFVEWLKSHWLQVLEVPHDYLTGHLRQERSLRYLPPTLYKFINEPDTADTAADLIRNMSFAASLYKEGKSLEFIRELLVDNPIERSLWDQFAVVFAAQEEHPRRRPGSRVDWVWSLETTEILLRLRNILLVTTATPDLAVWVAADSPADKLAFADVNMRLNPWRLKEGEWLVDELLFAPDGPPDGKIVLLGSDDTILWEQEIPSLPVEPAQFFRLSQQGVYALPVEASNVQGGRYVVACQSNITLNGEPAEVLLAQEALTLPHFIQSNYAKAGYYHVTLPLEIRRGEQVVAALATSSTAIAADPPYITGEAPVPGLSPRVPPTFCSLEITLAIPGATSRFMERTSLWLRPQGGTFQRYMLRELNWKVDNSDTCWLPLRPLLDDAGGYYTIELRQGLRAVLPAPLELACVPDLEVIPPAPQPEDGRVYTPRCLPVARIRGVTLEQIGNLSQLEAAPATDSWLALSWHDVRDDCRLLLQVNGQSILLAWAVKRFSAWVEPRPDRGVFTPDELEKVVLRAVGSRDIVEFFSFSIAGDDRKQQIALDARGQFREQLQHHGLRDMIRHRSERRVQVDVSVFKQAWPLLILEQHSTPPKVVTPYEPDAHRTADSRSRPATLAPGKSTQKKASDELSKLLAKERPTELTAETLWRLATIPAPVLTSFPPDQLKKLWAPLGVLKSIRDKQHWEKHVGLLPSWAVTSRPLVLILNRCPTLVFPEVVAWQGRRGIGNANLSFVHGWTQVYAAWEPAGIRNDLVSVRFGLPLGTPPKSYRYIDELDLEPVFQCHDCGYFLSYSQLQTGRHTHAGRKYPVTVDVLNTTIDEPFLARIAPSSKEAKLRYLQTPEEVIDSTVVAYSLTSDGWYPATAEPASNPISRAAHRYACSAWLKRYWEKPKADWYLKRLASNERWQCAAQELEQLLACSNAGPAPAYASAGRFLDAFRPRHTRTIYNLDRDLLLLALLARHDAYDPSGSGAVRRRLGLEKPLLGELLLGANTHAPELLEWAFGWVEIFFVHTLS
jgi:hypothetical protein